VALGKTDAAVRKNLQWARERLRIALDKECAPRTALRPVGQRDEREGEPVTAYNDETNKPSEECEPFPDDILCEVLTLIDELVDARLTGGELVRRRERIKAKVDGSHR
jgi:hypothetical protein